MLHGTVPTTILYIKHHCKKLGILENVRVQSSISHIVSMLFAEMN